MKKYYGRYVILMAVMAGSNTLHAQNNVGVNVPSPTERLHVDGRLRLNPSALGNPTGGGVIRWNGSDFEGWDGSTWKSLTAPAGITSLNGLTGTAQTFAFGNTGTAPAFISAGTTHTLNIPMAATAGVTGGLLSNTQYTTLLNGLVGAGTMNQTLRHNGTNWVASSAMVNDGSNVGIGAATPVTRLDVAGSGYATVGTGNRNVARFAQSTGSSGGGIEVVGRRTTGVTSSFIDFKNIDGSEYLMGRVAGMNGNEGERGNLTFWTNNSTTMGTPDLQERMRISSDGTVRLNAYTTNGIVRTTAGTGTLSSTGGGISLTSEVTGVLPIANGGTNSTAAPTNGGVAYGTGSAYAFTGAGASGQVLRSNGALAPTWADPTSSLTFENGLTATAPNIVRLGGDLNQATTTINVGSNTLNITGIQSKVAIGEGAQIETGGNRSVALGSQARVNGTESVAIGIGNTGTSSVTRATGYSLAIGQNIAASGGGNGTPVIAIGRGFSNTTSNSIMLGMGTGTTTPTGLPSITIRAAASAAVPGNVGIGTISPGQQLSVAGTLGISEAGNTGNRLLISSSGTGAEIFQNDNSPIIFKTQTGTQEKMRIMDSGNIAMGRSTAFNNNVRLSLEGGLLQHSVNLGGTYPAYISTGGWAAGWNFSAGGAEVDFWNVYNGGATPKGFVFRQQTGASSQTELMRVTGTGNVSWAGEVTSGNVPWARLTGVPAQANTWQTLGTSGNSVTLTNGGSVTVPYATSAGSAATVDCRGTVVINMSSTTDAVVTHNCNTTSLNIMCINGDVNNSSRHVLGVAYINANQFLVKLNSSWNGLFRFNYVITP